MQAHEVCMGPTARIPHPCKHGACDHAPMRAPHGPHLLALRQARGQQLLDLGSKLERMRLQQAGHQKVPEVGQHLGVLGEKLLGRQAEHALRELLNGRPGVMVVMD